MTILCLGDSNTYGYDPRGFLGGRYDQPWPELLGELTGHSVRSDGECGRRIPAGERRFPEQYDRILVMLGTNDLLNADPPKAIAERMARFLESLPPDRTILLAPPHLCRGAWVPDEALIRRSKALAGEYRAVADRLGIRFVDAGAWRIPMCYDGVHLTEEGHRIMAQRLAQTVFGENPCCKSSDSVVY